MNTRGYSFALSAFLLAGVAGAAQVCDRGQWPARLGIWDYSGFYL